MSQRANITDGPCHPDHIKMVHSAHPNIQNNSCQNLINYMIRNCDKELLKMLCGSTGLKLGKQKALLLGRVILNI